MKHIFSIVDCTINEAIEIMARYNQRLDDYEQILGELLNHEVLEEIAFNFDRIEKIRHGVEHAMKEKYPGWEWNEHDSVIDEEVLPTSSRNELRMIMKYSEKIIAIAIAEGTKQTHAESEEEPDDNID